MTDPQQNPLGVRLSLTKSVTRSNGEDWSKTIATIEMDKPAGVDALDGLRQMETTLNAFHAGDKVQLQPQSKQPQPEEKPVEQPKPSVDLTPLEPLWKVNSKGFAWIFSDKAPDLKRLLEQSSKHTIEIDGRTYKLSGDSNQFINRLGSKK